MQKTGLKFTELLRLSFRSFHTKPIRAVLTILGMSVGIGVVLFLVSLGYGLQYILIGKLITTEDSLITMEVSYPTESNIYIKREIVENLKKDPLVGEVSAVAEFAGEFRVSSTTGLLVNTLLVEPSYFRLSGLVPSIGSYPISNENGAVVSVQSFAPVGLTGDISTIGKLFDLQVFYQDEKNGTEEEAYSNVPIPVRGIISDESMQPTVITLVNSLSNQPPFFRKVLVKAKSIEDLEPLRDRLLSQGFIVSARVDLVNQARKITNIITIVLGIFGITALIVSAIGMFNTMIVGFMERIYEVGILKAIGATDSDVRNLFLLESVIMGMLGGVGGLFLGLFGGNSFNFLLSALATRLGGKSFDLFITPWWFIVLIIILSLLIGLLSGFWPAYRATKLSPKEAFTRK